MEAKQLVDRALEHHGKGELDEARNSTEKLYKKIIDKRVFTNLAAILRSQGVQIKRPGWPTRDYKNVTTTRRYY